MANARNAIADALTAFSSTYLSEKRRQEDRAEEERWKQFYANIAEKQLDLQVQSADRAERQFQMQEERYQKGLEDEERREAALIQQLEKAGLGTMSIEEFAAMSEVDKFQMARESHEMAMQSARLTHQRTRQLIAQGRGGGAGASRVPDRLSLMTKTDLSEREVDAVIDYMKRIEGGEKVSDPFGIYQGLMDRARGALDRNYQPVGGRGSSRSSGGSRTGLTYPQMQSLVNDGLSPDTVAMIDAELTAEQPNVARIAAMSRRPEDFIKTLLDAKNEMEGFMDKDEFGVPQAPTDGASLAAYNAARLKFESLAGKLVSNSSAPAGNADTETEVQPSNVAARAQARQASQQVAVENLADQTVTMVPRGSRMEEVARENENFRILDPDDPTDLDKLLQAEDERVRGTTGYHFREQLMANPVAGAVGSVGSGVGDFFEELGGAINSAYERGERRSGRSIFTGRTPEEQAEYNRNSPFSRTVVDPLWRYLSTPVER